MRAHIRTPQTLRAGVVVLVAASLALAGPIGHPAGLADPRIEDAEEATSERQAKLDELLADIDELEAEASDLRAELGELEAVEARHDSQASEAAESVRDQIRHSYKRGSADPLLAIVAADGPGTATQQARVLAVLANRNRQDAELASAARLRTGANAARVAELVDALEEAEAELSEREDEARQLLAQAEEEEAEMREQVRLERERERQRQRERERRAEERRLAEARASRSSERSDTGADDSAEEADDSADEASGSESSTTSGSGSQGAPVQGGVACPVGTPRNFSDTYGAARSGGRSHQGTDILAPMGTPIYAYEDGTITRLSNNRLGGITLYLQGDSGNQYYYAHLQGYVGGLSTGQRVSAGEQIATNGDTGNARGIPHLHIEVMPGGGGNVNPYPYMREACG